MDSFTFVYGFSFLSVRRWQKAYLISPLRPHSAALEWELRVASDLLVLCERWPHSFEQQPEGFKWTLCSFSRCQFTRRQHHGIGLIRVCLPRLECGLDWLYQPRYCVIEALASVTES
ncbi:MAG: hypothetical protein K0S58_1071 [Nitrospira sp.]|nr:hypothetical protein [Nitrospira sp.]